MEDNLLKVTNKEMIRRKQEVIVIVGKIRKNLLIVMEIQMSCNSCVRRWKRRKVVIKRWRRKVMIKRMKEK
jgi:hypothetical protein